MKWCKNADGSELMDTAQYPQGVAFRVLYDPTKHPLEAYAVLFNFPKELLDKSHDADELVYYNWLVSDRQPVPLEVPDNAALMIDTSGLVFEMETKPTVN
jgi:hypothetical protein